MWLSYQITKYGVILCGSKKRYRWGVVFSPECQCFLSLMRFLSDVIWNMWSIWRIGHTTSYMYCRVQAKSSNGPLRHRRPPGEWLKWVRWRVHYALLRQRRFPGHNAWRRRGGTISGCWGLPLFMEVKTNREHGKQGTKLTNGVPKNSLYFRYCSK